MDKVQKDYLCKLQEHMGNWRFCKAFEYWTALKNDESIKLLGFLKNYWGDTGWTRLCEEHPLIVDAVIDTLLENIRVLEGWNKNWESCFDIDERNKVLI